MAVRNTAEMAIEAECPYYYLYRCIITVRGSDDSIVFIRVLFLCDHDNSWTDALNRIKFCRNTYLDKLREFQEHESKVTVTGPDFRIFSPLRDRAKNVWRHDNSWTAALSLMKFCTRVHLDNL